MNIHLHYHTRIRSNHYKPCPHKRHHLNSICKSCCSHRVFQRRNPHMFCRHKFHHHCPICIHCYLDKNLGSQNLRRWYRLMLVHWWVNSLVQRCFHIQTPPHSMSIHLHCHTGIRSNRYKPCPHKIHHPNSICKSCCSHRVFQRRNPHMFCRHKFHHHCPICIHCYLDKNLGSQNLRRWYRLMLVHWWVNSLVQRCFHIQTPPHSMSIHWHYHTEIRSNRYKPCPHKIHHLNSTCKSCHSHRVPGSQYQRSFCQYKLHQHCPICTYCYLDNLVHLHYSNKHYLLRDFVSDF
mmetsp:Transcript_16307/g.28145  ORF Transcript_16307/g.28145 Transcript_16307/m.28145 type:complete len:291 (+) Transcript_16307:492-1364(+)